MLNTKQKLININRWLTEARGEVRRVTGIARHRNGVHGEPFHAVLFHERGPNSSLKLAVVFDQPHHIAVLDVMKLGRGDIGFGSNSWRGDWYERDIRRVFASVEADDTAQAPIRNADGRSV